MKVTVYPLPYAGNVAIPAPPVNSGSGLRYRPNVPTNQGGGYLGMNDERVARRIAWARLGRGWTQKQLGQKIGRSEHSVKSMETGRGVSPDLLMEVAAALGVSYAYLISGAAQDTDLDVIMEGARQEGWDRAVAEIRAALDGAKRKPKRA